MKQTGLKIVALHVDDEMPAGSITPEVSIVPSTLMSEYWTVLSASGAIGVIRSKSAAEMFRRSMIEGFSQMDNPVPEKD